MKGFALIAVIVGSVVGGGAGGVVATKYLMPPTKENIARASVDTEEAHDYSSDLNKQSDLIKDLKAQLSTLNSRIETAEARASENKKLSDKVEKLGDTVAKMESKPEAQPTPADDTSTAAPAQPSDPEFKAAVSKVVAEIKAEEKKAEEAAQEKRWADEAAKRNTATIDAMDKKLTLETWQKEKIAKVLEGQTAKFNELRAKGRAAQEKGEEFDWRKEMTTLAADSTAAVRAELTPAQQTIFDEATAERGLEAFAPRRGFGGGPGGGRGN